MSEAASLREAHEAFVSGHSGSSAYDLILAVFPAIPASVLGAVIVQGRSGWLWFFLDSTLLVLPFVLSFTALANYTLELYGTFVVLTGLTVCFMKYAQLLPYNTQKKGEKRLGCVTSLRASLSLATTIAILAVDFHCFPRRFAKTEEYGYSLMDVGATGFVIMNGIVEGKKRASLRFVLRDGVILTILGVLRLVLVRASDYQHHVTEYGVHGNFFFTLAFIKITCSWWVWRCSCAGSAVLALILCIGHHLHLTVGNGGAWTLSDAPRDTFLLANREWVVSMPGHVAAYLLGAALGSFIFSRAGTCKLSRPLSILTLCSGGCLVGLHYLLDLPSRRLCNPTFVTLCVFFVIIVTTHFSLVEDTLAEMLPGVPSVPLTFQAINRQPLIFFLLSNVATGLINKSINTLDVVYPWDVSIIVTYTMLLVSVVYVLLMNEPR